MTRVTLDRPTLDKLSQRGGRVVVCDETGHARGYFTPIAGELPEDDIIIPISEDEIRRREQKLGGRPLKEILDDLERGS
jgi:hypothetical protein